MDVHHREFTDQFRRDAYQTPGNRVDKGGTMLENRIAITHLHAPLAPLIEDNCIACTDRDTLLLSCNDQACNILLGHTRSRLCQAHKRPGSSSKYYHASSPHAREETAQRLHGYDLLMPSTSGGLYVKRQPQKRASSIVACVCAKRTQGQQCLGVRP